MSFYNFITIILDTLYMQSSCTGRALELQSVPGAHWGCPVNHRCITLTNLPMNPKRVQFIVLVHCYQSYLTLVLHLKLILIG